MESRPTELAWAATERAVVRLANGCRDRRARECSRIEPLIHIVRPGIWVFSRNLEREAAETGGSCDGARNRSGLAVLQRQDPVGVPATDEGVDQLTTVCKILSPSSKRQLVASAEMHDFLNVEITPAKVPANPKTG